MKRGIALILVGLMLAVPSLVMAKEEEGKYTKYLALKKDEVKALQLSAFIPGAGLGYIGTPKALERKNYYIMTEGLCALAAVGGLFITEKVDLGYGVTYTRTSGTGWAVSILGLLGYYYFKGKEKEEIRDLVIEYNKNLRKKLGIEKEVSLKDQRISIGLAYNF